MQTTQNFVELFLDSAEKHPEQIAIIEKNGETISYNDLKIQVESRAAYLYKHGIRQGDQVLLCVPGSIDLYRNILALLYVGAIIVLPGNSSDKAKVDQACKLSNCKALIGVPKTRLSAYFSKILRKIPVKLEAKSLHFQSIFPLTKVSSDQAAILTFDYSQMEDTLAEKRSHQFLFDSFQTVLDIIEPHLWEIALHTSELMVLAYLGIGATSVIGDLKINSAGQMDAERLLQQLRLYKVNRLTTSPDILIGLSDYMIEKVLELPDIQSIYCEGRPLFPHEMRLFPEGFPQAKILLGYGSSAASPMAISTPDEWVQDHPSCSGLFAGRLIPACEVKIIEIKEGPVQVSNQEELYDLILIPGEIGEIIVKGPPVLGAYYDNLEAFEQNKIVVDKDLWHRSGDAGYVLHGKLFYVGKCDKLIYHKGKYYGPLLYENYLKGIKQIKIGTLLEVEGKLTLVVELFKESDQEIAMKKLTHANLTFEQVIFIKLIPRNLQDYSRIDYDQLKKMLVMLKK